VDRAALRGRLTWQLAEVLDSVAETPTVRSLVLDVPEWPGHAPGQHVDVRLTAGDGYQAQRSYSIATPPDGSRVTITVERVADGEVSPYLVDELLVGDRLELRGPIGGYFVWRADGIQPLLLAGGGSGIVPLMAMLRTRIVAGDEVPIRMLVSARAPDELIYGEELEKVERDNPGVEIIRTFTRRQPPGWTGYARRVDRAMLADVAWPRDRSPRTFVCGPTGFVETVARSLVDMGHLPDSIRTERFGPTGG
jgi:ferredoxin-NADP reductase